MKANPVYTMAHVYTREGLYSIVTFDVDFWHQAMAVLFFKYKDKEGDLPRDMRSITEIKFTFRHG